MEPKKISFGFNKVSKKTLLGAPKSTDELSSKIELIKCLEGQSIKLVVEKTESEPKLLVIPLTGSANSKTSAALASLQARKAIIEGTEIKSAKSKTELPPDTSTNDPIDESIEKRAARELLLEVASNQNLDNDGNKLTLPIVSADELPLDGAKESTLADYNEIPVQQFGKAILRGMGWKDIPKKKNDITEIEDGPIQRPKGMGLGADKAIKRHVALIPPSSTEVLEIRKKAFVRILAGKHKDLYGQIEGFDDYAGRIVVKFALGGHTDSMNEFMVQPVSKKEYQEYGKVINSAKYDEYKKLENQQGQIIIQKEEITKSERTELKIKQELIPSTEIKLEKFTSSDKKSNSETIKHQHDKYLMNIKQEKRDKSNSPNKNYRHNGSRHVERRYQNRSRSSDSDDTNDSRSPSRHHSKSSKKKSSKKHKKSSRQLSKSPENPRYNKKKSKKHKKERHRSRSPRKYK